MPPVVYGASREKESRRTDRAATFRTSLGPEWKEAGGASPRPGCRAVEWEIAWVRRTALLYTLYVVVSNDIRKRLLYVKYLLSRSRRAHGEGDELGVAVSLLLMHDAAEMLMLAVV